MIKINYIKNNKMKQVTYVYYCVASEDWFSGENIMCKFYDKGGTKIILDNFLHYIDLKLVKISKDARNFNQFYFVFLDSLFKIISNALIKS